MATEDTGRVDLDLTRTIRDGARMIRLHRAAYRWRCIRRGHALICTSLGHVCSRCGRSYERLP